MRAFLRDRPVLAVTLAVVVAGLLYMVFRPAYQVVGPSPGDGEMTVILLHGYGAGADDMVPTAEAMNAELPDLTVIIPRAPHRAARGCGGTWQPDGSATELIDGRHETVAELDHLIDSLWEQGVSLDDLYLAGYSQGAGMAAFYATESAEPRPIRGLILFSGEFLPHSSDSNRRVDHLPDDFRVTVVHGDDDRVLPISNGRAMATYFEDQGVDVEFYEFRGGHGIHPTARRHVMEFLSEHH